MKNLLLFTILFFYSLFALSQTTISGKILDEGDKSVPFATILLKSPVDSQLVKGELSSVEGTFSLVNIKPAKYWLTITYVGMETYESEVFELTEGQTLAWPTVTLATASQELKTMTVKAARPILEVKADKMVFNVEGSINAVGNDGLELLRKAPSVIVDNNDNISLAGKTGVQVFIDGKRSPLSGEDLTIFLESLNSSSVDNIEIITNPSAKFDAAGNAGIINIRMKKDKNLGGNVTLNAGYSVGVKPRYNVSISSNYRNKRFNIFSTLGYNRRNRWSLLNLYKRFDDTGRTSQQNDTITGTGNAFNVKLGTDYFLSKKSTIGFLFSSNINQGDNRVNSRTLLGDIGSTEFDTILIANNERERERNNYNFNLNYRFENRKTGTSVNVDADYGRFRNDGQEYQPNIYFDQANNNILAQNIFFFETPTDIDIYTGKVDIEKNLGKGKLSFGSKYANVITDNTFNVYDVIDDNNVLDIDRSNQFEYTERVVAIYANYAQSFKNFTFQAGIRPERTHSTGILTAMKETDNDEVNSTYINLFPSAGITYTIDKNNSLQLTYSRRIDRPSYDGLNPFEYKLNERSFRKGNPFLRPQYSHNLKLTHTYKYGFNTSVNYSYTNDLMTRLIQQAEGIENASVLTWRNLDKQHHYSLTLSMPVNITKWWSSFSNLTAFHLQNITAATAETPSVNLEVNSFNIFSQHTFLLPKDFKFELSGRYSSPSIWGGTFKTDGNWNIDAGLQKRFFNNQANLKIGVSDIFRAAGWSGTNNFDYFSRSSGEWDSRRFKVDFSYSLGNQKIKGSRRKTGLEEEKKRAK